MLVGRQVGEWIWWREMGYDWRVGDGAVWFGGGTGIKKAPGTSVSGAEGAATYSPACAVPSA